MTIDELFEGDCRSYMALIPDDSVDCVVTDPPYGMGFQSNRSKKGPRHRKLAQDDKIDAAWLSDAFRVLKNGGGLLSFCDWRTSCDWRRHIEAAGFSVRSQVIWDRMHHGMGDLRGGFAPRHDVIWYATKGRRIFAGGRPRSVIASKRPSPSEDFGHPTCKPVDLMVTLLRAVDDGSGGIVLDPFAGSGSTLVAAETLGRPWLGCEIDPEYAAIAKRRLRKRFAMPAVSDSSDDKEDIFG